MYVFAPGLVVPWLIVVSIENRQAPVVFTQLPAGAAVKVGVSDV